VQPLACAVAIKHRDNFFFFGGGERRLMFVLLQKKSICHLLLARFGRAYAFFSECKTNKPTYFLASLFTAWFKNRSKSFALYLDKGKV